VFSEEFVHEFADRGLRRLGNKLVIFPLVPERSLPTKLLAEFCADRHRDSDALSYLLPLPLGHRSDHRVEEATCRRARIYRLLERNQIGVMLAEHIGEVEELSGIAGKAGEFGKDEATDVPGLDVLQHPLSFRMAHHSFAAHAFEVIDLTDVPTLRFSVKPRALFVVLRALAASLIFRRNSNPDSDRFYRWL